MFDRFDFARPRTFVVAAVVVGVLSGLAGAVFHSIVTEPRVDDAIAIEDAAAGSDGSDGSDDEVVVSRTTQKGAGLFAAYGLTGAAFGLFLSVTALSLRTRSADPFRRVLVAGGILAGAITVAPWLKYPPNPPAVGDPATVGDREWLYMALIVATGLLLAGAAHLSGRLRGAGWADDRRIAVVVLAAGPAFAALVAALPASPDPIEVPANLVWQFRLGSLAGNLLVWSLLTVGLGVLCAEAQRRAASAAAGSPGPADTPGPADQNSMPLRAEIPSS
ncbi:MAG: CbtA family protein [Acidimicrobiales bacterium]